MSNEHVRITLRLTIPEAQALIGFVDVGLRTLQERARKDPETVLRLSDDPERYAAAVESLAKKLDKARQTFVKAVVQ